MSFSFLQPDRRFRPAGWLPSSLFSGAVSRFTGYNNTGITVDDGRNEQGYGLTYPQASRGLQVAVSRGVYQLATPPDDSTSNEDAEARQSTEVYLRLAGLSCQQWIALSPQDKYNVVQMIAMITSYENAIIIIDRIDRYCVASTRSSNVGTFGRVLSDAYDSYYMRRY